MPTFDIIKESKPSKTFRVASVIGKFDLQSENIVEHFKGDIQFKRLLKSKITRGFHRQLLMKHTKAFFQYLQLYNLKQTRIGH